MPRWENVLAGAMPGGLDGLPTLRAKLGAMPKGEARVLVDQLLSAWISGSLDAGLLFGTAVDPAPVVRRLWDALHEDDLAPFEIERMPPSGGGGWPTRWAWTPRWILMSQDEDLFLFGHGEELLRAAVHADCPRRDLAISIAMHDVRDQANAWAVGQEPRDDPFALAKKLAPLARDAGATYAAAYFDRLVAHAARAKVDRDGALARASDLHRCFVPRPEDVEVKLERDEWAVGYRGPNRTSPAFFVHRKTGTIRPAIRPKH